MNMNKFSTFTISTRPYYEEGLQQYKNILVTNIEPLGPLRRFVRRININRNHPPYDQYNDYTYNNGRGGQCAFAIVSLATIEYNCYHGNNCCNGNGLMTPD